MFETAKERRRFSTRERGKHDPIIALLNGFKKKDNTAIDKSVSNPWEWAQKYRTYMGKLVDYAASRLEPWKAILESKAENRMIMKGRKVTASEQMINDCLFNLERSPFCHSGIFFPNQEPTANAFSASRIRPAVKDSKRLTECIKVDKVESKSFVFSNEFEQFLYIYGVETTLGLSGDKIRSFALRNAYYDEVQMINPEAHSVIDQAKKPDYPDFPKWCSGTPTTPGNILNTTFWENSNQNLLLIKCPSCRTWNNLNLKENIWYKPFNVRGEMHPEFSYPLDDLNDIHNAFFGCMRCGTSLEGYRGGYGRYNDGAIVQWQPQKNSINLPYAGWHFTKFIIGLESAVGILRQCADPKYTKRKIYNEICGVPYVGEDSPFSPEAMRFSMLRKTSFDQISRSDFDFFVATVDWGKPSWFAVHGYVVEGKNTKMVLLDVGHTPEGADERTHGRTLCKRLARKWPELSLILCDHGYSVGREKDFYEHFGQKKVYSIDSNVGKTSAIREDIINIQPRQVRKTHVIKTGRDFMIEGAEQCLDPHNTTWFVPYADPGRMFDGMPLHKYIAHAANVYRQPAEEFNKKAKVFTEIKYEKTAYFIDTGSPDHFLMIWAYAALVLDPKIRRFLIPNIVKAM